MAAPGLSRALVVAVKVPSPEAPRPGRPLTWAEQECRLTAADGWCPDGDDVYDIDNVGRLDPGRRPR